MSHETQGSGYDAGAAGHELQGRQTRGQKLTGVSFNPSGRFDVHKSKTWHAELIDELDAILKDPKASGEHKRCAAIAIHEAQTAQMWAVKALTWQD
jgi:hypothetical protein